MGETPPDISSLDPRTSRVEIQASGVEGSEEIISEAAALRLQVVSEGEHPRPRAVRLYRNGVRVGEWTGPAASADPGRGIRALAPLAPGQNVLTAYAVNRSGVRGETAVLRLAARASSARTRCFVLSAAPPGPAGARLTRAETAARAFGSGLRRALAAGGSFDEVRLATITGRDVARGRARAALEPLAGIAGDSARPGDAVIVYYAGAAAASRLEPAEPFAGIRRSGQGGRRMPFPTDPLGLLLALSRSRAGRILLVAEACEAAASGSLDLPEIAAVAEGMGAHVLVSAQGDCGEWTVPASEPGSLVRALLGETLDARWSDRAPKDGRVDLEEWLRYGASRALELEIARARAAGAHPAEQPRLPRIRALLPREPARPPLYVAPAPAVERDPRSRGPRAGLEGSPG